MERSLSANDKEGKFKIKLMQQKQVVQRKN